MKTVGLENLKTDWINLLRRMSPKIHEVAPKIVLCSFNPQWTGLAFALSKDEVPIGVWPNFDDYKFCFEFDELAPPLNVIYSAYDRDGKFEITYNSKVIDLDKGDHIFNRPIISLTSIWTYEFLLTDHPTVSHLYFTDSDFVYPCILPQPPEYRFWDPIAFYNGEENPKYLEKIFGAPTPPIS